MMIAVARMRMMQVATYQVIDMAAVGHRLVTAIRTMHMPTVVPSALVAAGANIRIAGADFQHVLIGVVAVRRVQVAIVKVIEMIPVPDCRVAAAGPMNMCVILVYVTGH
jgi:hypothetical protein